MPAVDRQGYSDGRFGRTDLNENRNPATRRLAPAPPIAEGARRTTSTRPSARRGPLSTAASGPETMAPARRASSTRWPSDPSPAARSWHARGAATWARRSRSVNAELLARARVVPVLRGGAAAHIGGRAGPLGGSLTHYSLKQPVGVAGQIIPWNFPMLMVAWKWGRRWRPAARSCSSRPSRRR